MNFEVLAKQYALLKTQATFWKILYLKIMRADQKIFVWTAYHFCLTVQQSNTLILIVFRLTIELSSRAYKDSNHFRILS